MSQSWTGEGNRLVKQTCTNSVKCISSIAESSKDSIEFSSNSKEHLGLNPRLRSICQSLTCLCFIFTITGSFTGWALMKNRECC